MASNLVFTCEKCGAKNYVEVAADDLKKVTRDQAEGEKPISGRHITREVTEGIGSNEQL